MNKDDNRPDLDHLLAELNDLDPLVRQEAAIGLSDFCRNDHPCIDVLIERLRSPDQTVHDRACASWALGRIGVKAAEVVPILMTVIEAIQDKPEADELRSYAAEAVERLTNDIDVLMTVAHRCLADRDWQCRMKGLIIVKRLLKRHPELRGDLVPLIEPLLKDEVEGFREDARRFLDGFEEDE